MDADVLTSQIHNGLSNKMSRKRNNKVATYRIQMISNISIKYKTKRAQPSGHPSFFHSFQISPCRASIRMPLLMINCNWGTKAYSDSGKTVPQSPRKVLLEPLLAVLISTFLTLPSVLGSVSTIIPMAHMFLTTWMSFSVHQHSSSSCKGGASLTCLFWKIFFMNVECRMVPPLWVVSKCTGQCSKMIFCLFIVIRKVLSWTMEREWKFVTLVSSWTLPSRDSVHTASFFKWLVIMFWIDFGRPWAALTVSLRAPWVEGSSGHFLF